MTLPSLRRAHAVLLVLTALLTALSPLANAEETLGRLFFTPERRQMLDRQRQLNVQDKQQLNEEPTLMINGVVTRSSGKRTTWINGAAQNEDEVRGGVSVAPDGKAAGKVIVQTNDLPKTEARVGETVNRNTGETHDLLYDGRIVVNPGKAAQ
jgi:hypothetical protein